MGFWKDWLVEVRHGTKVTYSPGDLNKLDRTYERDVAKLAQRKVLSPLRKEPQRAFTAQVRDYAFEQILDRHLYTFSHLLVIPNPYGLAQQTALLLFNSSKPYRVRYRVQGDCGADFVAETELTKRHRVAVMGLYFNRSNKVDLYLVDEHDRVVKHRMIRIYVADAPIRSADVLARIDNQKILRYPMTLVNGATLRPVVLDANGDVRYALRLRTNRMGMIPLQDGHFLFADRTASCVNALGKIQPCRYHEMDYMGRVYRTYMIQDPIGTVAAARGAYFYFAIPSDARHLADCIIVMDRNTGEIVQRQKLVAFLGKKYRKMRNWLRLSHMVCQGDELRLTLSRLHTILCLDATTLQPRWAKGDPKMWAGTPLAPYVTPLEAEETEAFGGDEVKKVIDTLPFLPDIQALSQGIDAKESPVYGHLDRPPLFEGELPPQTTERVPKPYFRRAHLCDNLFLFSILPGTVQRVYFRSGKATYVQDYTGLRPRRRHEMFAVQVDEFVPGEYHIFVEYEDKVWQLKNEIRVLSKRKAR